jgi:hypothetical protein
VYKKRLAGVPLFGSERIGHFDIALLRFEPPLALIG